MVEQNPERGVSGRLTEHSAEQQVIHFVDVTGG